MGSVSSVVEGEHGGDCGEPDAGDEERVPDFGLVVALQWECVADRGLCVGAVYTTTNSIENPKNFPTKKVSVKGVHSASFKLSLYPPPIGSLQDELGPPLSS